MTVDAAAAAEAAAAGEDGHADDDDDYLTVRHCMTFVDDEVVAVAVVVAMVA